MEEGKKHFAFLLIFISGISGTFSFREKT